MDIGHAINIIYEGLYGCDSIPVKLRSAKHLDMNRLNEVMEALNYTIDYYRDAEAVPKKLALSLVDISSLFVFKEGYFDDETLLNLENIGMELQEKAYVLFS